MEFILERLSNIIISFIDSTGYAENLIVSDDIKVKVSPVPAAEFLNVTVENSIESSFYLEILNNRSKVVSTKNISSKTNFTVDINQLTNGIYYLRLTNNNFTQTKLFIKQ